MAVIINTETCWITVAKELDSLEAWHSKSEMKSNVTKYKTLYLVNSRKLYCKLRTNLLEKAEQKKAVWTCQSQGNCEEPDEINVKIAIAFCRYIG